MISRSAVFEILGLIGPNGSGKSTVMKLIMGVESPDAGTVVLDGINKAGLPPHRIARAGISIMFQHSRPRRRQTVLENIRLALLPDLRLGQKATVLQLPVDPRAARRERPLERQPNGPVIDLVPTRTELSDR